MKNRKILYRLHFLKRGGGGSRGRCRLGFTIFLSRYEANISERYRWGLALCFTYITTWRDWPNDEEKFFLFVESKTAQRIAFKPPRIPQSSAYISESKYSHFIELKSFKIFSSNKYRNIFRFSCKNKCETSVSYSQVNAMMKCF